MSLLFDIPGFEVGKEGVLLSFSGGPDSVYLALALKTALSSGQVTLVYFDHGLRSSEEIEAERTFVADFARAHSFSVVLEPLPVRAYAQSIGASLEEAGRTLRYRRLVELARERGVGVVCTAHHLDDNVESVLMKILRGSLSGLTPMTPVRELDGVLLVRPLLNTTKSHILDVLREEKVTYCVDSSNTSDAFLRNRIRLELVPVLERMNPQYRRKVLGLAQYHADLRRYVEDVLKTPLTKVKRTPSGWEISRSAVMALEPFLQGELIRRLIALAYGMDFRVSAIQIKSILAQLQKSGCRRVNLPRNHWVILSQFNVTFIDH